MLTIAFRRGGGLGIETCKSIVFDQTGFANASGLGLTTQVPLKPVMPLGTLCTPDTRKRVKSQAHLVEDPALDVDFQKVLRWLTAPERNLAEHVVLATDAAIKYVLDGARTKRLDLFDPSVDKDERSSVGTKLQYHVLEELGLQKVSPLDTVIDGVAVELKTTVRSNWTIPVEGQCEVTLLIRADPANGRVSAWLMRAHRVWLNEGTNQDKKRTAAKLNFAAYALPLMPWTRLPDEPLRQLSTEDSDFVLGKAGIRRRLSRLFSAAPDTVIPRTSIAIVGGNAGDFMKRAREAKKEIAASAGLLTLVGTWPPQRTAAIELGFDMWGESWVAVTPQRISSQGGQLPRMLGIDPSKESDRHFLELVRCLPADVRDTWVRKYPDLAR